VLSSAQAFILAAGKKIVKGATLKIYQGAPHGLPTTHEDQLNEDLLSFLRS
jgi:non-heme chloroperoxidase